MAFAFRYKFEVEFEEELWEGLSCSVSPVVKLIDLPPRVLSYERGTPFLIHTGQRTTCTHHGMYPSWHLPISHSPNLPFTHLAILWEGLSWSVSPVVKLINLLPRLDIHPTAAEQTRHI